MLEERLSVYDILYGHRPKEKQLNNFNQMLIIAKHFIYTNSGAYTRNISFSITSNSYYLKKSNIKKYCNQK
jgi:hypothetical protein